MWDFVGSSIDGGPFELAGIDLWSNRWERIDGKLADIRDPLHGQPYQFRVYRVRMDRRSIEFAAGEFSPCVFGFFVHKRTRERLTRWAEQAGPVELP